MTAIDPAIVAALTEGRLASEDDTTCDACGDAYDPDTGCAHDGRHLCAADLHLCRECVADSHYFTDEVRD